MYEVEVKAVLRNRNEVVQNLINLGCEFSEELHQIDYLFMPKEAGFPPPLGTKVLRVRKQNDKFIFNLKIPQKTRQDCIEHELEISDGKEMIEIIKLLGYVEAPTVKKKRIKTKVGDVEIVLDQVEELGEFVEAEKIVEHEDHEDRKKVQDELFAFLETLGIKKEDRVIDGKYDIMLWEKLQKTQGNPV